MEALYHNFGILKDMDIHLFLHDFVYAVDVLLVLFLIILILVKSKSGISKWMLIMTWLCVIIFVVSHAIGVSVSDSELSRKILMFNLVDIFLPLFSAHSVFALLSKNQQQKKILVALYTFAIGLAGTFIAFPSLFLATSTPKLYFPNYYVPGPYYWLMLVFFFGLTVYFLIWMTNVYKISNGIEKNRIKYFFLALLLGFSVGSIDFLLIYDIQVDPLWGFLFVPLSVIPFTYAALKYELMSINVIAKKAFVYAIITAAIGGVFIGLNYVNTIISHNYPQFPNIISSFVMASLVAASIIIIWKKVKEADLLKYEFMSVVTHKFRTPLTSIKWITEELKSTAPNNLIDSIRDIQTANERLVELTGFLSNISVSEDTSYEHSFSKVDIGLIINHCLEERLDKAKYKGVRLIYKAQPPIFLIGSEQKIQFVLQTLIDNAISYTASGGKITLEVSYSKRLFSAKKVIIRISDTGIGIPRDEAKYIFTKFYRAKNSRKVDTEGMGIGLYLSRNIIERHKGKIDFESEGEGKGTTFIIVLPILNE